jgi:hypothetical protein
MYYWVCLIIILNLDIPDSNAKIIGCNCTSIYFTDILPGLPPLKMQEYNQNTDGHQVQYVISGIIDVDVGVGQSQLGYGREVAQVRVFVLEKSCDLGVG